MIGPRLSNDAWALLFLAVLIIVTSVGVAYSAYRTRQGLSQLQTLEAERDQLEVEWTQLLLEEHAWGSYSRIGAMATAQLHMQSPAPSDVVMVRP